MRQARKISSRTIHEGSFFRVVSETFERSDGSTTSWEVVRHPGAVGVIAVGDDGAILMVRQSRHTVQDNLLEIPAGKLEPGEDHVDCARRELEEETGFRGSLEQLKTYYSTPGFSDERVHLFIARDLEKVSEPPTHDGSEPIEIEWLSGDDLVNAMFDGRIEDGKTLVGICLYLLQQERLD